MNATSPKLASTFVALGLALLPTLASAVRSRDPDAPIPAPPMTAQQRARTERDRRWRAAYAQHQRDEAMRRELLHRELRHARNRNW